MRIRHNTSAGVGTTGDSRRPVALRVAGLTIELSQAEARHLADALHDTADQETTNE